MAPPIADVDPQDPTRPWSLITDPTEESSNPTDPTIWSAGAGEPTAPLDVTAVVPAGPPFAAPTGPPNPSLPPPGGPAGAAPTAPKRSIVPLLLVVALLAGLLGGVIGAAIGRNSADKTTSASAPVTTGVSSAGTVPVTSSADPSGTAGSPGASPSTTGAPSATPGVSAPASGPNAPADTTPGLVPAQRGRLGIVIQDTTDGSSGVVVQSVVPDTPAAAAGLEAGDVITAVDGTPVADSAELRAAVRRLAAGATVELTVTRNGASQKLTATLAS